FPRLGRFNLEAGDEKHKAQARIDRKSLVPILARHDKPAELSRGGVVGMTFEMGAESKNLRALEGKVEERVQCVQHPEPNGDAAPEPARARHVAGDRAGKSKR